MHQWVTRLGSVLVLVLAAGPMAGRAVAALLGDASIPYRAVRTVTVNGHSYSGAVFHIPGRERHEQEIQGIPEIVILDAAATRGWLVLPALKTYVEFAFPQLMAELGDAKLLRSPVGQEVVNGISTTKYHIDHTAADGMHAEGFVWVSAKGVLMRIDGTVTRPNAKTPTAIRMELANLQFGPQDPSLFDLPPGLTELPSEALQPLLGGKSGS
jgi:hypothetical protein